MSDKALAVVDARRRMWKRFRIRGATVDVCLISLRRIDVNGMETIQELLT